jgi:ABC-type phosphate/phosphonate transport system permease subunit
VAIALVGTLGAAILALPLGLLAAKNVTTARSCIS